MTTTVHAKPACPAAVVVAAIAATAALLAGCAGGATTRPSGPDDDVSTAVTAGEAVRLDGSDVSVEIAAGQLEDDGTLRLSEPDTEEPDAGAVALDVAVEPVEIELTTGLARHADVSFATPPEWGDGLVPVVAWRDEQGQWRWLPTRERVQDGATVAVGRTPALSEGFLGAVDTDADARELLREVRGWATGRAGADSPECSATPEVRDDLRVESQPGDSIEWCVGRKDGETVLEVVNDRRTYTQISAPGTTVSGDGVVAIDDLVEASARAPRLAAQLSDEGGAVLVPPGGSATFGVSSGSLPVDVRATSSSLGVLLSTLTTALDRFSAMSDSARSPTVAESGRVLDLLAGGRGAGTAWADATWACLDDLAAVSDEPGGLVDGLDQFRRVVALGGRCGAEIGAAGVSGAGEGGWLDSSTAATVSAVLRAVFARFDDLAPGLRATWDAAGFDAAEDEDRSYDLELSQIMHTETVVVNPFDSGGSIDADYTVSDESYRVNCAYGDESPVATTPGTIRCGGTADNTFACWPDPASTNAMYCLDDPWETVLRHVATSGGRPSGTSEPSEPKPFGIELRDGTQCSYRVGGAVDFSAPGTVITYFCDRPGSEFDSLVVPDYEEEFQLIDGWWTVLSSATGSDEDALPAPQREQIATMYYIGAG